MMQTFQKDPVRQTNLGSLDKNDRSVLSVASFDASRRNLMVVLDGPNKGRFCAEPPADIALNVESKSKGGVAAEGGKTEARLKLDAQAETDYRDTVTILAQRTVLLDIYRTGAYTLCQYYLNGALSSEEASRQFFTLTEKVLDAYAKQANAVPVAPSASATAK
jgi:hypothetical protein